MRQELLEVMMGMRSFQKDLHARPVIGIGWEVDSCVFRAAFPLRMVPAIPTGITFYFFYNEFYFFQYSWLTVFCQFSTI